MIYVVNYLHEHNSFALIWITTLECFDIAYTVSLLSQYQLAAREGHFMAMTHMFGYLKKHPKGRLIIDVNPTPPIREIAKFSDGHSWTEFYEDCEENMPYDMPLSDGQEATLTCFVDADHARNKVSCRSVTGLILLLNNTPIYWMLQ